MYRFGMLVVIALCSGSPTIVLAAADRVPKLDVTGSCRGAATAATAADAKATMQRCLDSEQKTYEQLVKVWLTFTPADRATCAKSMVVFEPTYTELLSCLEMAQPIKNSN
jgi:hypothetical protein